MQLLQTHQRNTIEINRRYLEQHTNPMVFNLDHHFDIQITKIKDAERTECRASNSFSGEGAVDRINKLLIKQLNTD